MSRTFSLLRTLPILLLVVACSDAGGSASPSTVAPSGPPMASPSGDASPAAESPASSPAGSGAAVEVVGVDYGFEGVPATVTAGTTFGFRNGGDEAHELVLVRKNEGVAESFEELLAMGDAAFEQITFVGQVAANPGETADGTLTADAPGEYLMVCFVPQGMTELPSGSLGPDASLPAGAPHFTLGMLAEFAID